MRSGLSITQLATRTSVRPDTIRYDEKTGLLPAPARTAGEHLRYDDRALDRLQFIRGAKRLGLRLDAIAELLELRDAGQCPCNSAAAMLCDQLAAMLTAIPGPACPDPATGTWRPAITRDGGTAISMLSTCCPPDTSTGRR
ncbi:MAG: MerR family transcriptional regulator [Trebonia sp.]